MKTNKKGLQKVTALLLATIMILSAFAMMPGDLFKADAATGASLNDRLELNFNNNWKFYLGDDASASTKMFDDSTWGTVELPHDFSITQDFLSAGTEAESGNLPGGTGWYRKTFTMSSDARDKAVILNFDGAYKDTYVYVNGQLVGENHYGYNSFSFDISEYLVCNGETANIIAVKVQNILPSSRWYSGSGIYRDVTMTIVDPVHVALYGTQVTTPNIESSNGNDGTVHATITLNNDNSYDQTVSVATQILDATGTPVGTASQAEVTARHGAQTTATLTPTLANPNLWNSWDLGTPYLYTLRTTVSENGKVIDTYDTEFGYRWFNWDADGGFSLNGHNLKIEGVCMHHDQGVLGAAQEYDAIYRQVMILKDMGCNSIRTSHGTPSDVFMDICNELGMLVMNEFFDGWNAPKNGNTNDFSVYFDQEIDITTNNILNAEADQMWYEFVTVQTVKRDRNDPSIVIWDVGNELTEGATGVVASEFNVIAQNMQTIIDQLDPTRPICQGNNGPTDSIRTAVDGFMDVIGGNYNMSTWSNIMTGTSDSRSTKPYVGTETASALSTRGHYSNAYYNSVLTMINAANSDYAINAYDTGKVSWGEVAAAAWYNTIIYDWNSGEYVWTGFDYIGEPTPWNTTGTPNDDPNSSYFGIIDTAGFAKDTYYLYRSMWNEHSTTLHLVPGTWKSSDLTLSNGYANVAVYSNADHIELLRNGSVIATAQSTTHTTNAGHKYQTWAETVTNSSYATTTEFYTGTGKDLYPQFTVKQSDSDVISVKAYDANDNEITNTVGTDEISAVTATKIVPTTWADSSKTYTADGDNFIYIEYTAQDADGNFDATYDGTLNITVNGNEAEIVGVDNGNPVDTVRFQQDSVFENGENTAKVQMFNGKALVVLRTNEEVGDVEITATATNATVEGVTFTTSSEAGDELLDEFEEAMPQPENLRYEPTMFDEWEQLYNEITAGGSATASNEFVRYTAGGATGGTPTSLEAVASTDLNSFSDGWYVITGVADWNDYSEGVMTHTTVNSGFRADGTESTVVPATTSDAWYFERQGDGSFYIYYEDASGTKQYLNINSSKPSVSTSPQALTVTISTSSKITISDGSGHYINYSGGEVDVVGVWTAATDLTLYKVIGGTGSNAQYPVEDGTYVIYNDDTRYPGNSGILTNTKDSIGIPIEITTPVNDVITTDPVNAYTFTRVDGTTDEYYIRNSEGKYLSFGSGGGSIAFSDSAASLKVFARSDGTINIYNDAGQFLDHYYSASQNHYNTWSSTTSATDVNRIFALYRNESGAVDIPAGKEDLYDALYEGVQVAPGEYSNATYQPLFKAIKDGYAVFNDENATADDIAAAEQAITLAMGNLEVEYKALPTTLYKYGYRPSESSPYSQGGIPFNALTYASMKETLSDENGPYLAQIKTAIGYDTRTWASDSEKATALDAAIDQYARIYSISFTGAAVTSGNSVNDFAKTAWNVWCKTGTQGANEATEEGASVQGIFSALRQDGQPVDHANYSTLPYGNAIDNTNRSSYNTINGISVSLTINGTATSVTLPALDNISIHINDMFKKELVLEDGTVANGYDANANYAKFYWDLQFPLMTTTNEYGINTYTYKSSDTSYIFQTEFDDENQTATAELTPVDSWSIDRDSKGAGTGFFPFNYQKGVTSFTGERAIYHYAMNYDMEFYIPMSGTYADGEDVIFEFSGDDDVLVYVDDVLILDNGGLHGARSASINFTDASISYQYAMDVDAEDGLVESTTENGVTYYYGQTADNGLNGDELAALEKLDEVRSDGDYHTFSFYYVERGSTDSNCEMTFNLQQSSEHVLLHDQTVVVDFGLPVADFNITGDNFISQDAIDAGTKIELMGVMPGNTAVADIVDFDRDNVEAGLDSIFSDTNTTVTVNGMKYGDATVTKTTNANYANADDATVSYTPNTVQMNGTDYFYICSEVTDDPTYAEGTVYYQYEKVGFIPATSIYFEDNFAGTGMSFIDGTAGDGSDVGKWEVVGDASLFADATQAADRVEDTSANPYGYDPVYSGADDTKDYTQYSGFSAHKVTVSAQNNKKNGGTNPTFEFTFTGTGFDVVSLTDKTTGVFYMEIFDKDGNRVGKRNVVDTYYGYAYGQLYADANGEATLTETETPLYKSADNEATTREVTYYATDDTGAMIVTRDASEALYLDISGTGYTETPTYYDADGNLTETETEEIAYAYAYAYGWIPSDGDVAGLYQIPVIKKTGLDYGTYRVVLTAMYTTMFDNTGAGQFDLYVDGIRIYDPAGKDNAIADSNILTDYKYDNESYPDYIEFRDMLIGADSLSDDATTQGVVFIDGIAALDNDLDKLKLAGPNNELYLASTPTQQAVAFELWATAVPDEVQIGVKAASGNPKLKITYADASGEQEIKTATEMNYIINNILPDGSRLTWSEVVVDGVTYYRTNTIVIQNASETDSILSITNIKWTFTGVGQYGHYESSVTETAAVMSLMSTGATVNEAYTMMKVEAPVVDEPTTDEPTTDEPTTDEPTTDEPADDEVDTEIIPGDDDNVNDTNDEYQEELSWIQKIIKAITDFFKSLFGMA